MNDVKDTQEYVASGKYVPPLKTDFEYAVTACSAGAAVGLISVGIPSGVCSALLTAPFCNFIGPVGVAGVAVGYAAIEAAAWLKNNGATRTFDKGSFGPLTQVSKKLRHLFLASALVTGAVSTVTIAEVPSFIARNVLKQAGPSTK